MGQSQNTSMIIFLVCFFQISIVLSSSDFIYSNDTLSLTLSSNTRNLIGAQSSRHSLEFLLKNTGSSAQFVVSQESRHGVVGKLVTESILLQNGQFVTLKVDDIIIPNGKSSNLEFTLQVDKRDYDGSDMENWRYEFQNEEPGLERQKTQTSEYVPPGNKSSVSCSVIFNVEEGPRAQEKDLPLANVWKTEDVCSEVEQCTDAHWMVNFSAEDLGSGMFSVKLKSSDDHYKAFWWHGSFKIGSKKQVKGAAWISCCTKMVEVEIEDVAMNKLVVSADKDDRLRWEIIVPVVVGVAAVIAVLIIIVGVCVCRRKYSALSQTTV